MVSIKKIHRLVYEAWVRKLNPGEQVNHRDDNKNNNHVDNLYVGTQKDNIQDCIRNNHRVGRIKKLCVFDKECSKELTFIPAIKVFEYAGHKAPANGATAKGMEHPWFKTRFAVLFYGPVKSVTTRGDECNPVE